MKVTQPSPDELFVSECPVFTGIACSLIFVSCFGVFVYRLTLHANSSRETYGPLLAAILGGLGVWFFFRKTVVHFDRRIGLVNWKRISIKGMSTGDIPLTDIKDVVTESIYGNHGPTYRVTLLTSAGRWPLTDYYVGNSYTCGQVKDAIMTFLTFTARPEAVSFEESLRYLASSGQRIEAIKLARTQRKLSLTDAEKLVRTLSLENADAKILEERLRPLVACGQRLEAIKLAHSEGNLSLLAARQLVDKLSQPN